MTTEWSQMEYTTEEQEKAVKWCDALYFKKALSMPNIGGGHLDFEELKAVDIEYGMITITMNEGTMMRIGVDTSNISVDTTNFIPLPEDIERIRESQK